MNKALIVAALIAAVSTPVLADEVRVGPNAGGMFPKTDQTDHTTVVEPKANHTVVVKPKHRHHDTVVKERGTGMDKDTVIRHDED